MEILAVLVYRRGDMKKILMGLLLIGGLAGCLHAAPAIATGGIVNAASSKPVGAPGSSLARGALISIYGRAMGPATGVSAAAFPLQNTLAGVAVRVTGGSGAAVNAIPIFVRADQINAVLPSNTPAGRVSFTVTYQNETSPAATAEVAAASFGVFTRNNSGNGPGTIQNVVSETERPLNSFAGPARPGQALVAYGTGLGAIAGADNIRPPAADFKDTTVEILIGGRPAKRLYAGRSPCCAGLDEVDFQLADDTPTGCYVPVVIKAGEFYSNFTTIAVASGSGACSDPLNPVASGLTGGGSKAVGTIALARFAVQLPPPPVPGTISTTDFAVANFFRADNLFSDALLSLPPVGACSLLTVGAVSGLPNTVLAAPAPNLLAAGTPLQIVGPNGGQQLPRAANGFYTATLARQTTGGRPGPRPLYLAPGAYTITSPGGGAVGPFTAAVELPAPLTWTNQEQITVVNRAQPLTVTWRGGNRDREAALVAGLSLDDAGTTLSLFLCLAPLAPGSFTVPASVLSGLPPSSINSFVSLLMVGSTYSTVPTFTAPGLDIGAFYQTSGSVQTVAYQ